MQKFTIFTVIFSVIVLSVTTELVVQDYLQKLYPPPETIQANVLAEDDFGVYYNEGNQTPLDETKDDEDESDDTTNQDEEPRVSKVREILNEQRDDETEGTLGVANGSNLRIRNLLPALNIDNVRFELANYPGKLFHLIDTDDLEIEEISYGLFKVGTETVGSAYEFTLSTEIDAENTFDLLNIRANDFEDISTNSTDQFGEQSYYINNIVKVNEVFVVFQQDQIIYAFAYKKSFHDLFKAFFVVLA